MGAYDIFLKSEHNSFIQDMLIRNNTYLVKWLKKKYFNGKDSIKMLEIGPGKGYFYKAVNNVGGIDYYAADRNENILSNLQLSKEKIILGTLPEIDIPEKMDIIFAGYVIEHLPNGIKLYESLQVMKRALNDDGVIVLLFPDAMKLKMELWNIDYTHCFPTTKRNVNECARDCGLYVDSWTDLNGILFSRKIDNRFINCMRRGLFSLYSYNLFSFLVKPFYRKPLWDLNNVFWRFYVMVKEYNVMFVLKKDEE